MQEHVGKKRRKEVREAINMRKQLNSALMLMIAIFAVGCIITAAVEIMTFNGMISSMDFVAQTVPIVIVFFLIVLLGSRAYKWSGLRGEFKQHCKRYNITKEDMKDLESGRM